MRQAQGLYASGPEARLFLRALSRLATDPLARELNVNRLRVLFFLYGEPGHQANLTQIAPILGLTSSSLSRAGDTLVQLDLISRIPGDDKRTIQFKLTIAGIAFCQRILLIFAGL